jgi:murein L,D-transpeptidase YafK
MYTIHIVKKQRRLQLLSGSSIILSCGIGLGPAPAQPKTREGDGKTPEGRYAVCTRNAQSNYPLFLGLNYPSPADAQPAFEQGVITLAQFEAICRAHANGLRPPWDTPLGGQIGIHGGGIENGNRLMDSTAGCIALRDDDIRKLWTYADIGTPVIILP